MADGWKDIGKGQAVSFRVHGLGLDWHKIVSMQLSKLQERRDIRQAVTAWDAAHSAMRHSKKIFQRHAPDYLTEFLNLQKPILENIRKCIQEGYFTRFINNALKKRMLEQVQDFLKNHPEATNAKNRFDRFLRDFTNDLFTERTHINSLQKAAGFEPVITGAVKKRFFLSTGFFGRTYRIFRERYLISREFSYEKRAERIEERKMLSEAECYQLIGLLEQFHKKSTKLAYDIVILTLKLFNSMKDYETALREGIERIDLPEESTKRLLVDFKALRENSNLVFENEVEMINQLMGEEKATAKKAKKAFATGKLAFATG